MTDITKKRELAHDQVKRLDKLNAYKKLLQTKRLPKPIEGADKSVDDEILAEFEEWILSRIDGLLGGTSTAGQADRSSLPFSPDEVYALKQLAAQVQSKYRTQPRNGLANGSDTVDTHLKANHAILSQARRLEEMQRNVKTSNGEEFNPDAPSG